MLYQYKACVEEVDFSGSHLELGLLAGRPTAKSMKFGVSSNGWKVLSRIQLATAMGHADTELAAIRNILPISMLHELEAIGEVPLRSLELLCGEIGSISRNVADSSATINGEPLQNLNRLLLRLQEDCYKALDSEAGVSDFERSKKALDQLLLRTSHDKRNVDERTQHLHRSLESTFGPQQPHMPVALGETYTDIAHTSADFIQFFTGCLLLYVPDRPYDPALKPVVQRNRHRKRRLELENKLQALQDFELVLSGQKLNLRSQLVEKKINELGAEPEVPVIFRPRVSELGQLQAEFNNVVTSVIMNSPTPKTLQSVIRRESIKIQEVELLRMNIAQAVSRLSDNFQAYEDITKPLIGFLQGLDVGLALSLLTGDQQEPRDKSIRHICKMTPFLGASPQGLVGTTVADLDIYRLQNFDPREHFLRCTGVARCVSKDLGEPLLQTMLQTFDSFYLEWKEQLSQDQRHSAANSSLYRYRGGEEESNEADEQDFHRLFPNSDPLNEQDIPSNGSIYDARDQAQRIAGLQRKIFGAAEIASEPLLDLVKSASEGFAGLWKDNSKISTCPILAENLFSALVLALDRHKERLLGKAEVGKLYNFYSDANLSEARIMIALVEETQARFLDLQEAWPEHATLADVLRTSSDLLTLRHTEPIAKILTKAEQLHGYIHEWQVVASKQYTAAKLYDQLTDQLVSWRRLELSTWARLLDMEDQKCNKDADSWWFIAYEIIIAAPLSMIDEGKNLQVHKEQLFITLADFMTTTSIGQYAHRLGMIDCFRSHLEILATNVPSIGLVHSALSNFLSYYARFESPIQEHLLKGRQKVEKDMKEILLLASWKDTNINALRDSAKRSHHKLFKVIRRYRSLLAQCAETLITKGFSSGDRVSARSERNHNTAAVTKVDLRAIQSCKIHLENWTSKPERFANPISTAQRMFQTSQLPPAAIDGALCLDSFGTDLVDSIKALQKETPSNVTEANGEALKHLKIRKRKLYAETLKALRHMGFRSNLSVDTLEKQSSPSIVLANTPAFATEAHPQIASAEFHFHQVLRMIPEIKERSRNHSEDLSHGEFTRSMGYLESIVSLILKQRGVLATSLADLQSLHKTTEMMYNLWAPDSYVVKKQESGIQNTAKEVQYALRWLPAIIEAGSVITEKHGNMGKIDHSNTLTDLGVWKDKVTATNAAFDQLPKLPSNLSSSRHEDIYFDAAELLKDFKVNLQKLVENSPSLVFVLKQIAQWASGDISPNVLQMNGDHPTSLLNFDNNLSKALNSILVAMQRMQEVSANMPSSDEDATWLICADSSLAASLKSLHPHEVNGLLWEAMDEIQYLSAADVPAAAALSALALPIVEQFRSIVQMSFDRYAELHRAFCQFSDYLAHSFSQIVQEGFCSPAENSAAEAGSTEKPESGTGLGEGEGTEDISKDIQDEEDLSELAQGTEKSKEKGDIEDQEDAVNMNHDELEGEMEDVSDKGREDDSASESQENDIDEEAGDVDSLDPSAVDEKLWDGEAGETNKEKEGLTDKGKPEKDGQFADDAGNQRERTQQQEDEEQEENDDEASQNGVEEADEVAREEAEEIGPHSQDGQNLELPEQMDLDNLDGTDAESASGSSEMEDISDAEQENKEPDGPSEDSQDGESEEEAEPGRMLKISQKTNPETIMTSKLMELKRLGLLPRQNHTLRT